VGLSAFASLLACFTYFTGDRVRTFMRWSWIIRYIHGRLDTAIQYEDTSEEGVRGSAFT
jgi:hypothetical protein